MSLISRLFSRPANEAGAPKPKEELPAVPPIGYGSDVEPMQAQQRSDTLAVIAAAFISPQQGQRTARYADFNRMDSGDIAAMLDSVVNGALTFEDVAEGRGFKIESDLPKIQALLNAAKEAGRLTETADEALRDMLKYGDAFAEPLFSGKQICGVQLYEPTQIYVNRNDKGQFPAGADSSGFPAAYQQRRQGAVVAGWYPWQLIHFKLYPSSKLTYSRKGLLDDLRSDWKKLQLIEQGMVTARVTRAYPRRLHMVDVTNKDRVEQERALTAYIARMTGRVFGKRPTNSDGLPVADVGEDLFIATGYTTGPDGKPLPKLNAVKTEDPAIAGLAAMDDVKYARQKVWSSVPSDTVGIQRNTSGDLDAQDLAYTRLLRQAQRQLERGLRAILDQVLLANGYLPAVTPYRIVLPTVDIKASWKHADARFRASMTVRNVLEMGMASRRWAMKELYNLSDLEIDAILSQMEDEANNPIFAPVLPARNGQPSVGGSVGKAGNDEVPTPTAPTVVPATGAKPGKAVSKNGINRGTKLGQKLRGNMSGG